MRAMRAWRWPLPQEHLARRARFFLPNNAISTISFLLSGIPRPTAREHRDRSDEPYAMMIRLLSPSAVGTVTCGNPPRT